MSVGDPLPPDFTVGTKSDWWKLRQVITVNIFASSFIHTIIIMIVTVIMN